MDIGLLLVVFLGVLLVFTILRNSRQQRDIRRVQDSLAIGTKVATGSGMLGTVVAVEDDAVILESEPGHRSRWVRGAIVRVYETPDAPETGEPGAGVDGPAEAAADSSAERPAGGQDSDPDGPATEDTRQGEQDAEGGSGERGGRRTSTD